MIDLLAEDLIRIEEAANICRTHFSTVFRGIMKGVPGPDGQRVRLDALRVGGKWVTTRAALQAFAEATTPKLDGVATTAPRTAKTRRKAAERAGEELEALGI